MLFGVESQTTETHKFHIKFISSMNDMGQVNMYYGFLIVLCYMYYMQLRVLCHRYIKIKYTFIKSKKRQVYLKILRFSMGFLEFVLVNT